MKVNYQERIEATVSQLKIIMQRQRTVTNRQKVQALYLLKSASNQSITEITEIWRVHRITAQRWLKGVAGLRYDRDISRATKKHQPRIKINGMS